MKKTFIAKMLAFVFVLSAVFVQFPFASKTAPTNGDGECDFELHCVYENTPLENMRFSVYRVAEMPTLGKFSLLPEFEKSGADFENIEKASDWNAVSKMLSAFVGSDSVSPFAELETDGNGSARLSSVPRGLYLFVGETLRISETDYSCSPFLVSLPDFDEHSEKWNFKVVAETKIGSSPVEPETTPTTDKKPNTEDPNDLADWIFPLVAASVGFVAALCLFFVVTDRSKKKN